MKKPRSCWSGFALEIGRVMVDWRVAELGKMFGVGQRHPVG